MNFSDLLALVDELPLFDAALLLAGDVKPAEVQRQLSRWTAAGRLVQLRRGLYTLAAPYRKTAPHPFSVANRLVSPSYVSLQSALDHWGLIPEYVPVTTSVTTGRPGRWETPLGIFEYRHIQASRFTGYRLIDLGGQNAFVATPEKALLDLVYLQPRADTPAFLHSLRLQNLDRLDLSVIREMAERLASPKVVRAAKQIAALAAAESEDYRTL